VTLRLAARVPVKPAPVALKVNGYVPATAEPVILMLTVKLVVEPFSFLTVAGLILMPEAFAGGVTVTGRVNPPLRLMVTVTGVVEPGAPLIVPGLTASEKSGPGPSSVTVKLTPVATDIVLCRLAVPGFGSTVKLTVPLPRPSTEVMCTHESVSVARLGQLDEVVTVKLPVPPPTGISTLLDPS
jgi:hypothetical protein